MGKSSFTTFLVIAVIIFSVAEIAFYRADHTTFLIRDASSMQLVNGITGEKFTLKAGEELNHIVENLNELKLKKEQPYDNTFGYDCALTFYKGNGEKISFFIDSPDSIRFQDHYYEVCRGAIDYDYIIGLI